MSSTRQFIYETLTGYPALQTLVGERVYQGESLVSSQQVKPFLVYRMGNDTDMGLSEADVFPHQQFFLVYVHDEPSDYVQIDQMVAAVIGAFRYNEASAANRVITTRYLETSRDLDDFVLKTIMRYVRFQLIMS